MRESWDDKSSRFDGSSNYCASCPVRRRQLGKLTWCRPPKLRVCKRTPGIMGRSPRVGGEQPLAESANRNLRTTGRRAWRLWRRLESRVCTLPKNLQPAGFELCQVQATPRVNSALTALTTNTELLTPVRIGPHRLIFKIYSRLRG